MNENVKDFFVPNVIVAGAPKCGTTALVDIFNAHPRVCLARIKEPRYFSRQLGEMENGMKGTGPKLSGTFEKGNSWYRSIFECNDLSNKITIEATTDYISREDTPEMIARYGSSAQLVIMIREPLMRTHSHFLEEDKLGFDYPSFDQMVLTNHPRLSHFIDTSNYPKHIQRFKNEMPGKPILIIAMEAFRAQPQEVFQQFLNFIGFDDPSFEWDFSTERNVQREVKHRKLAGLVTKLQYSKSASLLPTSIRRRLHSLRNVVMNVLSDEAEKSGVAEQISDRLKEPLAEAILYHQLVMKKGGVMQV